MGDNLENKPIDEGIPAEKGAIVKLQVNVSNLMNRIQSSISDKIPNNIPGTQIHAEKRVEGLFSDDTFDHDSLTANEAAVLKESMDQKYTPAMKVGARSRYKGLAIGLIAPYEFLLVGIVLLSASANSTTGAWYSISLKEMKEKFEGMGLSLTSKLLSSDISANALASYAGIGLAYQTLIWDAIIESLNNPSIASFAKLAAGVGTTALIHVNLEKILSNKEDASIQYDFNDATLAGMTEEQQKFFSKGINEVTQNLGRLSAEKDDIGLSRVIFATLKSLVNLIAVFDVEGKQKDKFDEIAQGLSKFENNYEGDLDKTFDIPKDIFDQISGICDFSTTLKNMFKSYSLLSNTEMGIDKKKNANVAALHDIIPLIMTEVESRGEKIIS